MSKTGKKNDYVPPNACKLMTKTQKSSGDTGGVPMYSRIGKETIIKDLTFVGQLKGGKGVESTFEQ